MTETDEAELARLMTESNKHPDDNEVQALAIQAAVNYIHAHGDDGHLFCNKSLFTASVNALVLFSYDDGTNTNEALNWYKERLSRCLDSCTKCVSLFQRGRRTLHETFITERGTDWKTAEAFSCVILTWEANRLFPLFAQNLQKYNHLKESQLDMEVPRDLLNCVAECLCAPGMLRIHAALRGIFDRVLFRLLSIDHPMVKKAEALSPGLIFLLMEGDEVQKKWAFKMFKDMYDRDNLIKAPQVHQDIVEEYEYHLRFIQNPSNNTDENREKFYRGLYALFDVVGEEAITGKFLDFAKDRPIDIETDEPILLTIFQVLRDHIMSYPDESLPYILRFFQLVLVKVEFRFWSHIGEYTFQNIMGTIIKNPHLVKHLALLRDTASFSGELNPAARVSDLLIWIDPFLESLTFSQRLKSIETLSMFLITLLESEHVVPLDTKAKLFVKACGLLSSGLTLPSQLYSSSLTTDLLARSDTRVVVDSKLVRFFDYGTSVAIFFPESERAKNAQVLKAAIEVICKALRFDILTFAQNSYLIQKGKKPSTLRFSPRLFQSILKQSFPRQLELAYQVLASLENVSTILPVGMQTADVKGFFKYLSQFFVKFSDIDAKNTKMILSDPKSLKGYWACVFSPDEGVYQSAVDVLYETFDAAGRLEGVHSLLENNIDYCIQAINDNLSNLIFIEFFEPCPRAVKVLSDVLEGLNSPLDGLFADYQMFNVSTKESLLLFWNRCWTFLDLIYVQTIKWAEIHRDLVEFTRDALDLSNSMLDCFKTIKDINETGNSKSVFNEITNTFPHMLIWLRLSDPGLLASCVKLIASTVDLATDLNYKLDPNVIELLAKYGSRAKKFNNKLTAAQSEEILMRAKIFDSDLVEKIIQESEDHRKQKALNADASTTSNSKESSREPTPISSMSRTRQLKIDNFGSLSRVAPVAPVKPKMPKSQLELAREKLNAKKAVAVNAAHTRRREQTVSDDSDMDDDDAYSLFNIKKPEKKNQGITLLEDKWTQQRKLIQDKKKEEEYSRLRLNVDMKPLYRRVLQWSYSRNDPYPDSELTSLVAVPDTFSNANDYIRAFEPLLLVECWSAICSARDREESKPMMVAIGSKSSVSDFFEVFISITRDELAEKQLKDSDLVVLALSDKDSNYKPKVSDVKRSTVSCLGKLHQIKHIKGSRADLTIRVSRSGSMNNWLTPHSPVMLMRVMQMTTVEREFSSLYGLQYYNLADQILKAKPSALVQVSESDMRKIRDTYQVNDSQAAAIGSSVSTEGFSLIQGPPGTGKTKTILGVVGYMLSSFRVPNSIAIPHGQHTTSAASTLDLSRGKKILVCAPSNAAVDELVIRMKDGILNSKGEKYVPNLVRLGRSDAINSAVKDRTLEELVDSRLGKTNTVTNNMDGLFKELNEIKKKIELCKIKIADEKNPAGDDVYQEKRELTKNTNAVKQKLDEEREKQNSSYRNREVNRRNVQAKILGDADIICATLSGSAHDMVASMGIKFDSVIIDEACQCTELSVVIPLRYGCKRCIMVGDPNQLPPTVLSSAAADSLYDQSLFVRMGKHTEPLLLNVQYRMNSAISKFPSNMFYQGKLLDGPQNDALTARPWHENKLFPPYRFFDIVEGQQLQNSKTFSFTNNVEVKIAIELVNKLFSTYNHTDFRNKIGVITPYKEQNRLLQQSFVREFGNNIKSEISFNTIDGFQGQEKEIIIMSCVRADSNSKGVGFLKDFRRMNVALTRPKCSMWILGHHDSLVKNSLWRGLIEDAVSRDCVSETLMGFTKNSSVMQSTAAAHHNHASSNGYNTNSYGNKKMGKQKKHDGDGETRYDPRNQYRERPANPTAPSNSSKTGAAGEPSTSDPQKETLVPSKNGVLPTRSTNIPPIASQTSVPVPVRSSTLPAQLPRGPSSSTPPTHQLHLVTNEQSIPTGPKSQRRQGPDPQGPGGSLSNLPKGPSSSYPQAFRTGPKSQRRQGPDPESPGGLLSNLPKGPSSLYPQASRTGSLPPQPSNSGSLPPQRPLQRKRPTHSVFIQTKRKR